MEVFVIPSPAVTEFIPMARDAMTAISTMMMAALLPAQWKMGITAQILTMDIQSGDPEIH